MNNQERAIRRLAAMIREAYESGISDEQGFCEPTDLQVRDSEWLDDWAGVQETDEPKAWKHALKVAERYLPLLQHVLAGRVTFLDPGVHYSQDDATAMLCEGVLDALQVRCIDFEFTSITRFDGERAKWCVFDNRPRNSKQVARCETFGEALAAASAVR